VKNLLSALLAFVVAVTAACAQQPVEEEDLPLFSQAELDQMLAPVALYPDELLSQLLMAATYPLEIVQAARWSRSHPELTGQDAVRAVDEEPWDPSVKSMLAFPRILQQMDEDLDWTRSLGDAFLAQQEQVMDTVQALRARAQEAGNLQSNEHVEVVEEQQTIVVRHVYPDIAYVPYYDPYVVYGSWWWPSYRPVRWTLWPDYSPYYGYRGFYWGPAVVVGHGFFFSRCDWRYRRLRVVDVPPFYYRRPPPPDHVWHHDRDHRRGVPYRHQRVHDRYADPNDPVPRREPRERRERTDRPQRGTVPVAPEQPLATPVGQEPRADSPSVAPPVPADRPRRRDEAAGEPGAPRTERRPRPGVEVPDVPAFAVPEPQSQSQPPVQTPQLEPRQREPRTSAEPRAPRTGEPRAPRSTEPRQPPIESRPPRNEPQESPPRRHEPQASQSPRYEARATRAVPPATRSAPSFSPPASAWSAPAPVIRAEQPRQAPPARQAAPRSERAPREARPARESPTQRGGNDDSHPRY
jgi:hypothetical protein